ncbi:Sir2 family NAD+-dependent deacetylase [Aeromonas sp. BIGb0445]|jgi:NAD-dependent deacetylase|uniref:Sir2 family NAD+-dependent deacetylase n=1 Tax=Aeromonas sp. BIGb0445 TaxID=2940593 RepID=UPI0021672E78|nr:Sir2 family NAD+-dependent deacetylase [Aeromonas sp. BIGb0445]MCS3459168.1 NAD-dependent deacetylase [Aeromonas sp. BIGb0445]
MQAPKHIVVLTGAGISAESGIKTFRASDGLWEEHKVEDVATPEGYHRDPVLVQGFYNARRQQLQQEQIHPNPAHYALARLERLYPEQITLITQNIDNLHERAGSQRLIHMHGELLRARCPVSGQVIEWRGDLHQEELCSCCQFPQPLRPHVVWFGEMPLGLDRIYGALAQCDLFISIGTSGAVYPAAGFVHEAGLNGAHTIELNLEPSELESQFDEKRYGPASLLVPAYVDELLQRCGVHKPKPVSGEDWMEMRDRL